MKKTTFLKMMFLAIVLIVGNLSLKGQSVVEHTFSAVSGTIDENISFSTQKNAAFEPAYNTNQLRLYSVRASGDGNTITFTPSNGIIINAVELVKASDDQSPSSVTASVDGGAVVEIKDTYSITGIAATSSVVIRNAHTGGSKNLQMRLTGVKVTYTKGGVAATSAPTFTPPAGTYTSVQSVALASATAGAKIYYTLDKTPPSAAGTLYTSPIEVNQGLTITAIAYDANDANPSSVVTAEYAINLTPVITVTPKTLSAFSLTVGDAPATKDLTVSGSNLTADLTAAITGTDASQFSVSPETLALDGGKFTVTYSPSAAAASHTATLTISSAGAEDVIIDLSGETLAVVDEGSASETFGTQTALTASYADGSFTSETDGVTVNYVHSRNEDTFPITGKGLLLRRADEPSSVEFVFTDGVGSFSFDYRKAYTGVNARALALVVDGVEVGKTDEFGSGSGEDATVHKYSYDVNKSGAVSVKITYPAGTAKGNRQVTIDNVNWTAYDPTAVTTAAPTFTPGGGTYTTTQNVTLASETENAKIYYTLDGTEPTSSSTLFVAGTPIVVSTSTTIKAIAYDANGANPSSVVTAVYNLPIEVANIAALRAITDPGTQQYRLVGEVVLTLKSVTLNAKYIQDATGAILIDDFDGNITTEYNVGDGISGIVGTLTSYGNMVQFVPVQDAGAATSTGNTLIPNEITLKELTVDIQAELITVKSVSITETGSFAAGTNYTLTDATGTGVLRLQYIDLPLVNTVIPKGPQDITGVILTFNDVQQLIPISMVPSNTTGISSVKTDAGAWTLNGKIMLNASAGETIEIFNIAGQKVSTTIAFDGLNSIEVSAKGVLIVKADNRISKVIVK